ncbi:MAG: 50S ribosomal protein L9 [Mycoplasmatales bacterium]
MKVILLEDVKKVGKKDEIVDVSLGYGTNFLLKNKKAVEATKSNLNKLNQKLANKQTLREEEIKKAQQLKAKLEAKVFEFTMHQGKNGNVFGKISSKQIVTKLKESGFEVERKKVKTDGVNHLGEEEVEIILDKEVTAKIKINVKGE